MKASVTGFIPNPNNYWARKHGIRGQAPTKDWNLQKAVVTGYTACSNQYYATRERLCYHPADKSFGGYGLVMTGAGQVQVQQQAPPPPPQSNTLPRETPYAGTGQKSRKEIREEYEKEYLARMEREEQESAELQKAAEELAKKESQTQTKPGATQSAMPKGWKPS